MRDSSGCLPVLTAALLAAFLFVALASAPSPISPPPLEPASESGDADHAPGPGWEAFPLAVQRWRGAILRHADAFGLDPCLVAAVVSVESAGNHRAISPRGARGLMQVMPFHFGPGEDPMDPETNLRAGARYLRALLDRSGGSLQRVLAGYHAGPAAMGRPASRWPSETRIYVERVLRLYREAVSRGGCR